MGTAKQLPRGLRNKNPLNIRIGNVWLGEVREPTDKEFEQFMTMGYGCRAAFILFRRYIRRYGLNTIGQLVSRWAPSNENNTRAYINAVCSYMKCSEDTILMYEDMPQMIRLFNAMCKVENGTTLDENVIISGYKMA